MSKEEHKEKEHAVEEAGPRTEDQQLIQEMHYLAVLVFLIVFIVLIQLVQIQSYYYHYA